MRLLYLACLVAWVLALVSLCRRRDIDIDRKVTWVVIVLLLNVVGAVLYFLLGPRRVSSTSGPGVDVEGDIDRDAKPIIPAGTSWNPIQGENRFAPGVGLNPKEGEGTETSEEDPGGRV